MLSLEDSRAIERCEDTYLEEPEHSNFDEDAYWDEADRRSEDDWFFKKIREEGL